MLMTSIGQAGSLLPDRALTIDRFSAFNRHWVHWLVGSAVTKSDLEVCRLPKSERVVDYSCRTTVKREVLI